MAINETTTSRRGVVAMLAAAAAVVPAAVIPKTAQAGEQDPVFALIETHRAATAEYVRLVYIKSAINFDDEAFAAANDAEQSAYGSVVEAQMELLTTKPTTVAGAAAVLAYVAGFWIEGDESSKKGLPIYESYGEDAMLSAGDGFLPMIAAALQRLTAV